MATQPQAQSLKSASAAPIQKIYAGGIGGALTVIVIALVQHYTKLIVDPTASAMLVLVVMFAAGYFANPSAGDTPVSS
jgi:hypothetical protein